MEKLFDVIAVNMETNKVRLMAERKTQRNAEAIVAMAVMRRGVEDELFVEVGHGTYREGDTYGTSSPASGATE